MFTPYQFFLNASFFLGPLYTIAGTASSRSDDGSSPQITLQRPFGYFGHSYNQIYVRTNNFSKLQCILNVVLWKNHFIQWLLGYPDHCAYEFNRNGNKMN